MFSVLFYQFCFSGCSSVYQNILSALVIVNSSMCSNICGSLVTLFVHRNILSGLVDVVMWTKIFCSNLLGEFLWAKISGIVQWVVLSPVYQNICLVWWIKFCRPEYLFPCSGCISVYQNICSGLLCLVLFIRYGFAGCSFW